MFNQLNQNKKLNFAIAIAIVFHFFGIIGIVFTSYKDWFINATSFNLLLMFGLIMFTQNSLSSNTYKKILGFEIGFLLFIIISFLIGFFAEVIGVNTGLLFGNYTYGSAMGSKILNVPILIGVQWFVTTYCCGVVVALMNTWAIKKIETIGNENTRLKQKTMPILFVFDAALLTTFFDYIIEPAAQNLGFWTWQNNEIPAYNYTCWFLVSCLIFAFFAKLKFNKHNKFAIHLLIIETIFFLAIRLYIK